MGGWVIGECQKAKGRYIRGIGRFLGEKDTGQSIKNHEIPPQKNDSKKYPISCFIERVFQLTTRQPSRSPAEPFRMTP